MIATDVVSYPENQIKTVSLYNTAWLLDVKIDTLLWLADEGVIEVADTGSSRNIEFRREDVAELLEMFGA